jgi:hypothetical protein
MARWKLTGKHYLNCPGTEWEYKEQDLQTQEEVRHRMAVPRFLDPDDPRTRKNANGDVVVCYEGSKEAPTDYIFVGQPTPDMVPLDEEAEALSEVEARRGQHPIDTLAGNGSYQDDIIARLTKAIESMGGVQPVNVPLADVSAEQFAELQATVQALLESNAVLQAQLLEKEPTIGRRA